MKYDDVVWKPLSHGLGRWTFPGLMSVDPMERRLRPLLPVAETKATFLRCRAGPQESGLFWNGGMAGAQQLNDEDRLEEDREALLMANVIFRKNNIWLDMTSLIESSILVGDALSTQLCFFYGGSVGRKMRKARWVRCLGCEWCHWMIVGTVRIGVSILKCPNLSGFWLDLLRNLSISTQKWTYHCAKPICKLTYLALPTLHQGPPLLPLELLLKQRPGGVAVDVDALFCTAHCYERGIHGCSTNLPTALHLCLGADGFSSRKIIRTAGGSIELGGCVADHKRGARLADHFPNLYQIYQTNLLLIDAQYELSQY